MSHHRNSLLVAVHRGRQAKATSETILKVVSGTRRLFKASLAAAQAITEEGDALFAVPIGKDAVEVVKALHDVCTSMDTWTASQGKQPGSEDNVDEFVNSAWAAVALWGDLGLWRILHQNIADSWRASLADSAKALKSRIPPSALLESTGIFTEKAQHASLADHIKALSESSLMSTTSAQLVAATALGKETGMCFSFKDESKEIQGLKLTARQAICLEWAAGQVHSFVAKGPESMVEFADSVTSKLSAKGMGSGADAALPMPKSLKELLAAMKQRGAELAAKKAEELKTT
jgi:hypothetical protein